MTILAINLQNLLQRIENARVAAGRHDAISLLAVSKTWPAACIREAALAGQRRFGESYLQEALQKQDALTDLQLDWHFIGPLQSNKTRAIAERFSWVHSVDRPRIAERLAVQRAPTLAPLNICLQINISGETTKSGCAPEAATELVRHVANMPTLRLRGLMAIPEPTADVARQAQHFAAVRRLQEKIRQDTGLPLDTLSMGMSHDLEAAIMEGATLVRVGTALFGQR